jgi:hypothetical protein
MIFPALPAKPLSSTAQKDRTAWLGIRDGVSGLVPAVSGPHDQNGRKRLKASKLRLDLGALPDINEPFPPKPKGTRRKTYQRIRNEIQALEAKAKTQHFKKSLNTQLFAYHVG